MHGEIREIILPCSPERSRRVRAAHRELLREHAAEELG